MAIDTALGEDPALGLLRPGETCWRRLTAPRAALLIDGADYFAALAAALERAQHSILIAAWALDGNIALDPDGGRASRLRSLINRAARRRPDLVVHILLWDYTLLSVFDSELWPRWHWHWRTPPNVHIHLDDRLPMGACHHQKLVVIDDYLAFCGGIDLTRKRWDTSAHNPDRPERRDLFGRFDMPFHDLQMMVDGAPAAALAALIRERWDKAGAPPVSQRPGGAHSELSDLWPGHVTPQFRNIAVGLSRTLPPEAGAPPVREIEAMFAAAIEGAERLIYIESQYLAVEDFGARLARRLAAVPELEAILVVPRISHGWLEHQTMDGRRARFLNHLKAANVMERVRIVAPYVTGKHGRAWIMVHSKAMIVDDRYLIVGSANISNRSMRMDSESDLVIEATRERDRRTVGNLRNRLLAEHLGVTPGVAATTAAQTERWTAVVDAHAEGPRGVVPVPVPENTAADDNLMAALGDPTEPIDSQLFLKAFVTVGGRGRRLVRWSWGMAFVFLLGLGLLVWRAAAAESAPALISDWQTALQPGWPAFLGTTGIYILGACLFVPLTGLVVATAFLFGVWPGFLYAFSGAGAAALAGYAAGHVLGRRGVGSLIGRRLRRYGAGLGQQGMATIALVRMLPVGPFTVSNLVAGASHIRLRDFLMGSVIGLAPGMLLLTALGSQLGRLWQTPSTGNLAVFAALALLWAGTAWIAQRWLQRRGLEMDRGS